MRQRMVGALAIAAAALSLSLAFDSAGDAQRPTHRATAGGTSASAVSDPRSSTTLQVLADEEWTKSIQRSEYWAEHRKQNGSAKASSSGPSSAPSFGSLGIFRALSQPFFGPLRSDDDGDEKAYAPTVSDTHRTICVRLCDGSFTPVSYSTSADNFASDEARCRSGCAAPARLYVLPAGSDTIEDAKDLNGKSYGDLKTAFLFRTSYVNACRCRPDPWERTALDQHRLYALEAQQVALREKLASTGKTVPVAERRIAQAAVREDIKETGEQIRDLRTALDVAKDLPAIQRPGARAAVIAAIASPLPTVTYLGGKTSDPKPAVARKVAPPTRTWNAQPSGLTRQPANVAAPAAQPKRADHATWRARALNSSGSDSR